VFGETPKTAVERSKQHQNGPLDGLTALPKLLNDSRFSSRPRRSDQDRPIATTYFVCPLQNPARPKPQASAPQVRQYRLLGQASCKNTGFVKHYLSPVSSPKQASFRFRGARAATRAALMLFRLACGGRHPADHIPRIVSTSYCRSRSSRRGRRLRHAGRVCSPGQKKSGANKYV
jgi:hypothetical protein